MKKNLIIAALFILTLLNANAQAWLTDFKQAQDLANEQNRNIVLVFQGSDWCAPCMKLEQDIWSSEVFKNYAKDHFVLLKADFPKRKANKLSVEQQEKNNQLAERYNSQGAFPMVVVLDSKGKVLGTTAYKKISPEEYISILSAF